MLFDEDLANGLDPSCSIRFDGGSELDLPAMVRVPGLGVSVDCHPSPARLLVASRI